MTDRDACILFLYKLQQRGFGVSFADYEGNDFELSELKNRKVDDEGFLSSYLLDSHKQPFCSFDFYPDGSFYRISAHDSTGWYGDEVDLKKYKEEND